MRSRCSDELGEEPIYCEAHHGDRDRDTDAVYWSGSEHEYYEAPEHRRLRIEAKAVQFLSGNVPYLLSARLHGPFEKTLWDNPWDSKRAQRRARAQKQAHLAGPRDRRPLTTDEARRGHSSPRATSDLLNTQRTSLYPLPSPETTNPPSAGKSEFLDDEGYNRIKGWREAVKSVPITKDPFWASQQLTIEHATVPRKRSADQTWLHTREPQKRKSADMRPSESPTRAATKTKKKQVGRFSDIVTQSAPGSFLHEDELACHQIAPFASSDNSRLANVSMGKSTALRATYHKSLKRLVCHRDSEMSEDELSVFSTTPSPPMDTRSSGRKYAKSASAVSPTRRRRNDRGGLVQAVEGKVEVGQPQETQLSASQRPVLNMAKGITRGAAGRGRGESQQDNSFCFHARQTSTAEEPQACQPSSLQMREEVLSLPAAQPRAPVSQPEGLRVSGQGDSLLPDDDDFVTTNSEEQMALTTERRLGLMSEAVEAPDYVGPESEGAAESKSQRLEARSEDQVLVRQESNVDHQPQQSSHDMGIESGPEHAAHICTQELSPVSMRCAMATAELAASVEDAIPQIPHSTNDFDSFNSERLVYNNMQDTRVASEDSTPGAGHIESIKGCLQDADKRADPNWTTCLNSQDLVFTPTSECKASDHLETVEQSPDDAPDPDWSIFMDTEDQCPAHEQNEGPKVPSTDFANVFIHEQNDGKVAVNGDVDSNSDRSTYISSSSHAHANETGDMGSEPVQTNSSASEAKFSQISSGGIIDAYAEDQSFKEVNDQKTRNAKVVTLQESMTAFLGREHEENCCTETSTKQDSDACLGNLEDVSASAAQPGNCGQAVTGSFQAEGSCLIDRDETTASLDAIQIGYTQTGKSDNVSQDTLAPRGATNVSVDNGIARGVMAITEYHLQSPWYSGGAPVLQTPEAPLKSLVILDETTMGIHEPSTQSPWVNGGIHTPPPVVMDNEANLDGSPSNLRMLAGAALVSTQEPQTPWLGDKCPSPGHWFPVKKFSDFMDPEPTRKLVSADGSILRGNDSCRHLLFGMSLPPKTKRHVTFASLPSEEEAGSAESRLKDDNDSCIDENVFDFDCNGDKTISMSFAKSKVRAASPPPIGVNSVNADEFPDYEHRFARHFEAMSKRKRKTAERAPRLLPSDSQQGSESQGFGAMAEAFIQASQTRKKSSELAVTFLKDNSQVGNPLAGKRHNSTCVNPLEEQENIEPVDDVSAVLDHLDDYFDNTWGVDTSAGIDMNKESRAQQHTKAASRWTENIGDPMLVPNVNVWAD